MTFLKQIAVLGLVFGLGTTFTRSWAAAPSAKADTKAANPAQAKADPNDSDDDADDAKGGRPAGARGPGRGPQALSGQISKLHEEMNEKLDLTDAQKKSINKLFDDHLQSMRNRGKDGESPDAEAQAKMKATRERMREAKKKGDDQTAEQLREEVRKMNQEREKARSEGLRTFLDSVKKELNEAQQPKFQEIVSRLRLDGTARSGGAEIGRIIRALHDPKVNATPDQQQKINEIVRTGFSRSEDGKFDQKKIDETFKRVREAIMKELTEDQRKAVEEILAKPEPTHPGSLTRERVHKRRASPAGTDKDADKGENDDPDE